MADDDIQFGVEADLDEQSAVRAAQKLGQIFGTILGGEGGDAGRAFTAGFDRAFRSSSLGKGTFKSVETEARQAAASINSIAGGARTAVDALENVRTVGETSSKALSDRFQAIQNDIVSLNAQSEAWKRTLREVGADDRLLAGIDQQIKVLRSNARDLEGDLNRGLTIDPERLNRLSVGFENANKLIFREVAVFQTLLRNLNSTQRVEGDRLTREVDRQAQERVLAAKQANSRFIVEEQGRNALLLAEARSSGRQQLAQQQATARTRIEIIRFTFRQIQILERGIAGAFRATGTIANSAYRTLASAVERTGNLFRRSNRDLNDGLNGALLQREATLDRSFDRQTRQVRQSLNEQTALYDRFERRASTGLIGAATGRSRLGGLLGGGLAIGGGYAVFRGIREGFEDVVDLNEALNATRQIFGSASNQVIKFSETSREALFLTQAEALQAAQSIGTFGKAAELTGSELAGFTTELTALATDLASFRNTSVDDAVGAISSALAGEIEPIRRRYGILLDQQTLQQRALNEGIIEEIRVLTPAERVLATYAQVMAVTATEQGDAARTALDFANASKRLGAEITTLFGAIVKSVIPIAEVVINRLNPALARLSELISTDSELSEGLRTLRNALVGAGVALSALLAARLAGEALGFLGIGVRALLTPVGLLVTLVAGLGAAVGALRTRSDNFRYITDGLRTLASDALTGGLSLLLESLRRLGRFLVDTVAPAIGRVAQSALPPLIFAIRVLVATINAVLIPAIRTGFGYIIDTAIPAALSLASALSQYLIPATIALGAAWFAVSAPLGVVVATLATLGGALLVLRRQSESVRAFTDSLGQSFLNLGRRLAAIAGTAADTALSVLATLGATLSDLFSRIDFAQLGVSVLGFVNTVGRLLGRAITSRIAVTAGLAIGGAAVALAGSFLLGFTEGVITGLPGAIDTILDALRLGLEALGAPSFFTSLFKNSFTGIATLVAGVFLASSLLRSFTTAGSRAASAFSSGFLPGIRNLARSAEAFRFPETAIRSQARDAAVQYQREFDRIIRNNRRLGTESALVASGAISRNSLDDQAIRRLNAEQERYIAGVGRATAASILFRRQWGDALRGTEDRWQALQDRVAQTGGWRAVGQRAGVALVTSFSAVLAGQQGGTQGLVGVVASILGALAIGGPVVAGITAIAGGAALLYSHLKGSNEAAELLAETTERIRDALRDSDDATGTLVDGIRTAIEDALGGSGGTALALLPDGFFASTAKQIEDGSFDIDNAFAAIASNLGLTTRQIQDILALNESGLIDFAGVLESSADNIDDALYDLFALNPLQTITPELERQAAAVLALTTALEEAGVPGSQVAAILGAIGIQADGASAAMRDLEEETRLLREGLSPIDAGFLADVEARAGSASEEVSGLSRLLQFETVANAVGRVTGLIDRVGDIGVDAFEAIKMELAGTGLALDNELTQYIRDLINEWIRLGQESDQAKRYLKIDEGIRADWEAMSGTLVRFNDDTGLLDDSAEEAAESVDLISAAFRELESQRSTRIRAQITAIQDQLEAAEGAAERAREALTSFITGRYADTAQAQVDNLIGNIGSIGSAIEDAIRQGGVRGDAALRSAVGGFESQLAGIIQAGFDDGLRTQEEFRALLAPLFAAVDEETGDAAGRILSNVDFTAGITPDAGREIAAALQRVIGGNNLEVATSAIMSAESEVERLQRQLDAAQASLEVDVKFSGDQVRAALQAAFDETGLSEGQRALILGQVTDSAVAAGQQSALAQAVAPTQNITIEDNSQQVVNVSGTTEPEATGAAVVREGRILASGRTTPSLYAQISSGGRAAI